MTYIYPMFTHFKEYSLSFQGYATQLNIKLQ
jgi:hypothetical protein